jgi:hypothetical protein
VVVNTKMIHKRTQTQAWVQGPEPHTDTELREDIEADTYQLKDKQQYQGET